MAEENIALAELIENFTEEMYCWILDPNSSPQTKRFLLPKMIQEQRFTYAVNVGSANDVEIVLKSPITAYEEGVLVYFKAPAANSGAMTIDVDGVGPIALVDREGNPLEAGDVPAGSLNIAQFDNTNFQLLVSAGGGGGVAISDIQNNTHTYKIDTGAANAYEIALTPAPSGYVEGQFFSFKAVNANTGASTIDVNGLGAKTIKRRDGSSLLAGDIGAGAYCIIGYDGVDFQLLSVESDIKVTPSPLSLVDGAAISFNMNSKFFDYKRLDTVESAITLTISNVIEGSNQILSVKKNIAGDVTITLAGGGLSFYGYNNAGFVGTPDIILSGNSGDIFDISFLARTANEIGVAIGKNGN